MVWNLALLFFRRGSQVCACLSGQSESKLKTKQNNLKRSLVKAFDTPIQSTNHNDATGTTKKIGKSDERRISTSSSTNSSNNHNHTPNRPTPTSNRIMANRKVLNRIMSARHVSRSIAEDADTSNSFDDGIGFNENKHTIMSNFEEWIKMATDNKITVKNF